MKLSEKIRYLREVEGSLRGLDRAMTQQELVRAIAEETKGRGISQSYLSQIESGARPHLTNTTRLLLARFFKVHPGYLVDDPEGYHAELLSDLPTPPSPPRGKTRPPPSPRARALLPRRPPLPGAPHASSSRGLSPLPPAP